MAQDYSREGRRCRTKIWFSNHCVLCNFPIIEGQTFFARISLSIQKRISSGVRKWQILLLTFWPAFPSILISSGAREQSSKKKKKKPKTMEKKSEWRVQEQKERARGGERETGRKKEPEYQKNIRPEYKGAFFLLQSLLPLPLSAALLSLSLSLLSSFLRQPEAPSPISFSSFFKSFPLKHLLVRRALTKRPNWNPTLHQFTFLFSPCRHSKPSTLTHTHITQLNSQDNITPYTYIHNIAHTQFTPYSSSAFLHITSNNGRRTSGGS